ncbi:hypothetical protein AAFH96_27235 [Polymorphospora sp. 2-325]|uniref:Uncharacterized protein n=2 Tax=Micromonosporaceae TaxID=28056 RepID=A0ABV5CXP4_9ACTN
MISRMPPLRPRRIAAVAAGLALAGAVIAGCSSSSEGASTQCGIDQCTVTFQRGVEANASIFGVEAKLVGVDGNLVTIEVAGQQLSLTTEQQAADVAGFQVTLDRVTDSEIAVKISR